MYWLLLKITGMDELRQEFQTMGIVMLAVLLAMGNAVFFLLDKLLRMQKWIKTK